MLAVVCPPKLSVKVPPVGAPLSATVSTVSAL